MIPKICHNEYNCVLLLPILDDSKRCKDPFSSHVKCSRLRDCSDIKSSSLLPLPSGVYEIHPFGAPSSFHVFCDFDIDGGGWTVIQRRVDGSVDFERGWNDYKCGFGSLDSEFWLGNEKMSLITAQRKYELRIELTGKGSYPRHAKYSSFRIGDESTFYRLYLGTYSGNAGDSLDYHRGMNFTTRDADNDKYEPGNCVTDYGNNGAWWFNSCDYSNLNGLYGVDSDRSPGGLEWKDHPGGSNGLKFTEMKIRAVEVDG
ncbi:Fibrinogen-like protein A [Holothuria leucospilota]|uniref:Fibrinogen-like protein A n=1 Tax=Holothuria leucospilota TaxID=206669 RepID=A0A9Q1CLM2_HOLLE|nr:Fibrinogen-like protein A [Holothuria leucospilota]